MKKLLLGALVALLPLTGMAATILGFQAGVGTWSHDPSGSIIASQNGVGTSADLKDQLQLSKESEGYSYFLIEHPVPLVPNFKYVSTKLSSSGSGNANISFDFNGTTYSTATPLTTSLVLDQTDAIFYYEILDNDLVSFDVGLAAKILDGSASVFDGTTLKESSFKGTIPMLYAAVEVGLPSGFSIAGELSTISAAGNEISDLTAKVMYTSDYNFGVEAGIRTQKILVDVDSVDTNVTFSGIFAGLFYRF